MTAIPSATCIACNSTLEAAGGRRIAARQHLEYPPQMMSTVTAEIEAGRRPWWCQRCAGLSCRNCGAPLKHPMGADILADEGEISHFAIFPMRPGCTNPACPA